MAFAQRLLESVAVGHVQHGEERIPVRQRNGCKFKTLSIGKCNAAAALLAFDRRSANQFTYRRNLLRFAELVGGPFHELIHARMDRKHFLLHATDLTEAVVTQRSEEHTQEPQSL